MGFSDEQIRDILELKEQLAEKIEKHVKEIEKLEKNISIRMDQLLQMYLFQMINFQLF
jgi:hypothetical protein